MSEVMNLIPFMSEIVKLNSIHVRNFETNSIHVRNFETNSIHVRNFETNSIQVRKFDFDPHFHGKIYYNNKHTIIKDFNMQGILILNIISLLQDNTCLPTIESVCVRR